MRPLSDFLAYYKFNPLGEPFSLGIIRLLNWEIARHRALEELISRSIQGRVTPDRLYHLVLQATESVDEAEEAKAHYELAMLKRGERLDDYTSDESGSRG